MTVFVLTATDEEISAMRRELEKYGIQMPAFSKIGGILANEMPVDEAARKHTTNFPPIFDRCVPSLLFFSCSACSRHRYQRSHRPPGGARHTRSAAEPDGASGQRQ